MKRIATAALVILLVSSLGLSGYLLFVDRPKAKEQLEAALKPDKGDNGLEQEYKKQIKSNNITIEQLNKDIAKAKLDLGEMAKHKANAEAATKKADGLAAQLAGVSTNETKLAEDIANLKSANKQLIDDNASTAASLTQLQTDLTNQLAIIAAKTNELQILQTEVTAFKNLGMSPAEILELKKKRPVAIELPIVPDLKPLVPGKIKQPISEPESKEPVTPAPQPPLSPQNNPNP
jgi:hypothetical protein